MRLTFPYGRVYTGAVADDEAPTPLPEGDDEATLGDGDAEPSDADDDGTEASGGSGEPTVRDVLVATRGEVERMVTAIDRGTTADVDMDGLLTSAREMLAALDTGPACPMCAGSGTLSIEPANDPRAERCTDCGGMGKVYTGSLVPESAVRPCGKCAGAGFTERATVTPLPTPDYAAPPPPAGAQWYDENDAGTWHLPIDPAKRGLALS